MEIKITTLSENTAAAGNLLAEWGLSILVETDAASVLLDCGQSISTGHNADIIGVNLSQIDTIVISHGHFDHTGGLRQTLDQMKKKIEIVAHPNIWANKYSRRPGQEDRYIGIPFKKQELEALGARFNLTAKPVQITDSIMTTGEVPMVTAFEQIDPNLYVKEDSDFKPDELLDDQALIINTGEGLIVVLGCAHRGIINTLYHAQQLTSTQQIRMVLGGCHLINATQERIWQTIAALKELGVASIGVSHCTGLPAAAILAGEFGDSFFFNNAGTRIDLP